jgi:hypothetical protein
MVARHRIHVAVDRDGKIGLRPLPLYNFEINDDGIDNFEFPLNSTLYDQHFLKGQGRWTIHQNHDEQDHR